MEITEKTLHFVSAFGASGFWFQGINPDTDEMYFECLATDDVRDDGWWEMVSDILNQFDYNFCDVMCNRNEHGNIELSIIEEENPDTEQWKEDFVKEA